MTETSGPITYRFYVEAPTVGGEWQEDVEFDEEPSEAELEDVLMTIYSNYFPGAWERLDDGPDCSISPSASARGTP